MKRKGSLKIFSAFRNQPTPETGRNKYYSHFLFFQFDIHPMLLTLQVDMKDSKKINAAVLGGFGITAFMFAVTTVLAAVRYGSDLDNNILQSELLLLFLFGVGYL